MGAAISYCSPQQVLSTAICDDGKGPDYNHLPCPVKYEEITHEAYSKTPYHQCQNFHHCLLTIQKNAYCIVASIIDI